MSELEKLKLKQIETRFELKELKSELKHNIDNLSIEQLLFSKKTEEVSNLQIRDEGMEDIIYSIGEYIIDNIIEPETKSSAHFAQIANSIISEQLAIRLQSRLAN